MYDRCPAAGELAKSEFTGIAMCAGTGRNWGLPMDTKREDEAVADRRRFLAAAGKFAVTVPPAMTFLLTTSLDSSAVPKSDKGNEGCGNGDDGDNTGKNREDQPGCDGRPDGT
jgi:hypothetical protein